MEPFYKNMAAALSMIHRWKHGEVKRNVEIYSSCPNDLPNVPCLFTEDVYKEKINAAQWRPEFLEKVYSEVFVRDQKYMKDIKCPISAFKQYAENPTDGAWCSKDIPVMHGLSCLKSEKNSFCLGCSIYWKTVQNISDSLRPNGPHDLLQYEADHVETFMGFITMQGSFQPQQREYLGFDICNTLVNFSLFFFTFYNFLSFSLLFVSCFISTVTNIISNFYIKLMYAKSFALLKKKKNTVLCRRSKEHSVVGVHCAK